MKKNNEDLRKNYVVPQTEVMKIEDTGCFLMGSDHNPNASSGDDDGINGSVGNGNSGGQI